MIHKAVIVVLTLAPIATAGLWTDSYCAVFPRTMTVRTLFNSSRYGVQCIQIDSSIVMSYHHCTTCNGRGDNHADTCPDKRSAWDFVDCRGGITGNRFVGLGWRFSHVPSMSFYHLRIPMAWIVVTLFAYPTIAFIRGPLRRWRRRKRDWCLKCGYDLTGNETGVCSECGTKIT